MLTRPQARIQARGLSKTFTLHAQGGARIVVFSDLDLTVYAGECVCLHGPSGSGKSSLLKSLYANYKLQNGQIFITHGGRSLDLAAADPWDVVEIRRHTIGYVSQFLRVIPRVSALEIVAEPARTMGHGKDDAAASARALLKRLNIPERLWDLAPATFSGGEQQRINVARGFVAHYPILLLDEPTASLDVTNRQTVIAMIREAKDRGAAIVGIFHDAEVRDAVADRLFEVERYRESVA